MHSQCTNAKYRYNISISMCSQPLTTEHPYNPCSPPFTLKVDFGSTTRFITIDTAVSFLTNECQILGRSSPYFYTSCIINKYKTPNQFSSFQSIAFGLMLTHLNAYHYIFFSLFHDFSTSPFLLIPAKKSQPYPPFRRRVIFI